MPLFDNLPQVLGQLRKARGLSPTELGRRAGLSRTAVSAYEAATTQPTLQTLGRILDVLEVTELQFLVALRTVEAGPESEPGSALRAALPETLSTDAVAHLAEALEHLGQFLRLAGLQLAPRSLPLVDGASQRHQNDTTDQP